MALSARLALIVLLCGAPAGAIQLQPGGDVETDVDCHTAVEGEACYEKVQWIIRRGIKYHPENWPSLTASSSFEEVQAAVYGNVRFAGLCFPPCLARQEAPKEAPQEAAEATEAAQAAEAAEAAAGEAPAVGEAVAAAPGDRPAEECRTAVPGELCHEKVRWAMEEGIVKHPEWYPTLSRASTFEDFQSFLHGRQRLARACPEPCRAQEAPLEAASDAPLIEDDAGLPTRPAPPTAPEDTPPALGGGRALDPGPLAPVERAPAEPASAAPAEQAEARDIKEEVGGGPSAGGCYTFMPTGCPNDHYFNKTADKWVEDTSSNARESELECLAQKDALDTWCKTDDVRVIWIPPTAPQMPSEKGCYVWLPAACPKRNITIVTDKWRRDEWGEIHAGAAASEEDCLKRKTKFDGFCGTKSAKMLWKGEDTPLPQRKKAPRLPKQRGCYMWLPSGCRTHSMDKAPEHWRRDDWGEANGCKDNTDKCFARKGAVNKYCGVDDAVMLRVIADSNSSKGYAMRLPRSEASEEILSDELDDDFEKMQEMLAEV